MSKEKLFEVIAKANIVNEEIDAKVVSQTVAMSDLRELLRAWAGTMRDFEKTRNTEHTRVESLVTLMALKKQLSTLQDEITEIEGSVQGALYLVDQAQRAADEQNT